MTGLTIDKMRATIRALSRPHQRRPVIVPPALGEVGMREHPELFAEREDGPPLFVVSRPIP